MSRRSTKLIFLGLITPTLIAVIATLLLMQWHKPTRIEIRLTVDRLSLTVAPVRIDRGPVTLIDYGKTRTMRVDRVARVSMAPDSLEIADESLFDPKSSRFPEAAWQTIEIRGEVALEGTSDSPSVASALTLQSADATNPGFIKQVRADRGARVTMDLGMEATGDQVWLTLVLDGTSTEVDLVFSEPFLLLADYLGLTAAGHPFAATETLSLRAASDTNTAVRVQGSTRGLVLQLEPFESVANLLAEGQIPVSSVDFTRQGPFGERRSSLIGPGTLSYPDLEAKEPLALAPGEFVSLDGLEKARIESLDVNNEGERTGLQLTLDAVAAFVRVGTPEQPRDARLTWFDWLWHQPMLSTLFAIIVWLFPTTLAGYRLWHQLGSSP